MDLFGIKARKERKAADAAFKAKQEELRFAKIKSEYQILKDRVGKESQESYDNARKKLTTENEICPKCKSKNVNDRIQRLQGSFSGSVSGHSSLFGGSMYGHSSGSIDTNEVNNCNDCGHQWKKYHMSYSDYTSLIEMYFSRLNYRMEEYHKAKTATVDKNDLDEKYTSDKEKQDALLSAFVDSFQLKSIKEVFAGVSIEAVQEIAKKEIYASKYGDRFEDFMEHWDEYFLMNFLGLKHIEI